MSDATLATAVAEQQATLLANQAAATLAALAATGASAPNSIRPRVIVIGAAKCGTTSLFDWLAARHDVFASP
ncbi:MAG: hypothetical protein AAF368_17240, partial [Planctomycetota bacterium]